ncbi:MAG: SDR family NAD(P)-dependent oxidoreductase [Patescibacteria group bacterium]
MFDLKGKVALVTGAKNGMGKTHALMLAQQGATVIVTNRKDSCSDVVTEIKKADGKAEGYALDVSKSKEVSRVFSTVAKKYGGLDILVNNAGIFYPKPALDITEKDWDQLMNINLKGQFLCAQAAAKIMVKKQYGRIINISSISSGGVGIGVGGGSHYTASKGGIIGMTEALALEWAPYGITVNSVAPGIIDTKMSRKTRMTPKQFKDFLAHYVPLNRIGRPEEVSAMVVFLASDESSYTTGATFYVDGGFLAA